jgi:hypothetical protein
VVAVSLGFSRILNQGLALAGAVVEAAE